MYSTATTIAGVCVLWHRSVFYFTSPHKGTFCDSSGHRNTFQAVSLQPPLAAYASFCSCLADRQDKPHTPQFPETKGNGKTLSTVR